MNTFYELSLNSFSSFISNGRFQMNDLPLFTICGMPQAQQASLFGFLALEIFSKDFSLI